MTRFEKACLAVDGDRGLDTTNDRVKHAIGAIEGVGGIQFHHITSVGKVIRYREL